MRSGKRLLLFLAILPLLFTLAGFYLSGTSYLSLAEQRSADLRFKVRGECKPDPSIVLIGIDEKSFQQLNIRYPFPPLLYADLIGILHDAGASVIAFDLLYSEPTRECDPPDQDRLLASTIASSGNVIWGQELTPNGILIEPIDIIRNQLAGSGFLNMPDEIDSRIRRFRTSLTGQGSFATAILKEHAGFIPPHFSDESLHIINYRGPTGTYPIYSLSDVLSGTVSTSTFSGKICLVGAAFTASHDLYATPFHRVSAPDMFGMEIHANILSTMLQGEPILPVHPYLPWAAVFLLASLLTLLLYLERPWISFLTWCLFSFGWLSASLFLFIQSGKLLPTVSPIGILLATFWVGAFYTYLMERERKRKIRELFSSYVDPAVVNWLIKSSESVGLDGQRCVVTVLDTDIEGFTAITSRTDPADLVKQLNEYFDALTTAALAEGGMRDKYVGDALMVIFGFPQEQPDHALRAFRAATEIRRRVDVMNEGWEKEGRPVFKTRIGIASGEVVMGRVGGKGSWSVTAMGEAANLASRLEGLNKRFGTSILMNDLAASLLPREIELRDLGEASIRGYEESTRVFSPAFDHEPSEPFSLTRGGSSSDTMVSSSE